MAPNTESSLLATRPLETKQPCLSQEMRGCSAPPPTRHLLYKRKMILSKLLKILNSI